LQERSGDGEDATEAEKDRLKEIIGRSNGPVSSMELNSKGLPLNPGAMICAWYVKTGECNYGAKCFKHHPEPAANSATFTLSALHTAAIMSLQKATAARNTPSLPTSTVNDADLAEAERMARQDLADEADDPLARAVSSQVKSGDGDNGQIAASPPRRIISSV